MTIAKKLTFLPIAAVAGIILVALILLRSIDQVYDAASYGTVNSVPSLLMLDKMEGHFASIQVLVRNYVEASNESMLPEIAKNIESTRQSIDATLKEYEALLSDDRDKQLLQAERDDFSAYFHLVERCMSVARTGKKVIDIDELVPEYHPLVEKISKDIETHRGYNQSLGVDAAQRAVKIRASAVAAGVVACLFSMALVGVLGFTTFRQITRQLGGEPADVARVAAKVATGDFSTAIDLRAGDESSLFATVRKMQGDLQERMERDQILMTENARIRTALDRVTVGTMLVDLDGKVIYANDCLLALFRQRAGDIATKLPNFASDRLIGMPFNTLHQIPAALSGTNTADVVFGRATLRVIANPVVAVGGKPVGVVVQWQDRTQEITAEAEIQNMVERAIDGDLTIRIAEEGKDGFFKVLATGMNRLTGNMAEVVRMMSRAASEVRSGADEISRGNLNLSQRTEEQASSLEETAASMEQMTSAVRNNADNAAQANQLAAAARDQAERGGKVVGSAVTAMSEINAASKKIADIIGVIDEIAFQTNLLALNAAVEAARAGEQGRGFAVVASEVRNLASRSAAAAKEIKGLIQDSVGKVTEGSRLVDESGKVLAEIVGGVKRVTDVVAEIAASSREQASGIEQVNKAVTSMDATTQQNAALVEEASAAAQALTEQAMNLTELIERYQVGDTRGAAAVTVRPAPKSVARADAAAAVERRSGSRPWSGAAKPAPTQGSAGDPGAPEPSVKVAAGSDSNWTDF
jgi:methyl-accepting chemotaxis protein